MLSLLLVAAGWIAVRFEQVLLILLYLLYLSLYQAGQVFTNFQWDYLLLESGFLAIFLPGGPRLVIWLERFAERLLEGSAPVLAQLRGPLPFDGAAPRRLRLQGYRYRFTTPEERAATGDWWRRDYLGPFYPLPSLSRPGQAMP